MDGLTDGLWGAGALCGVVGFDRAVDYGRPVYEIRLALGVLCNRGVVLLVKRTISWLNNNRSVVQLRSRISWIFESCSMYTLGQANRPYHLPRNHCTNSPSPHNASAICHLQSPIPHPRPGSSIHHATTPTTPTITSKEQKPNRRSQRRSFHNLVYCAGEGENEDGDGDSDGDGDG